MTTSLLFARLAALSHCGRILLAALLIAPAASASDGAERLDDYLRGLTTLEANFHQITFNADRSQMLESDGRLFLQRPGRFRWEYATAIAGKLLGINPFDEPNVTESKDNTKRLLAHYAEHGHLPQATPFITGDNVDLYMGDDTLLPLKELCKAHGYDADSRMEMLAAQFTGTHAGDYFGLLVYLPQTPAIEDKMRTIQRRLRHATRQAVTVGYGPRFLHSTGQLHKGGPNKGVFFQITAEHPLDIAIPDAPYTFGTLNDAQAAGDMQALQAHHRRVIRLHIKGDWQAGLDKVLAAINFVDERRK